MSRTDSPVGRVPTQLGPADGEARISRMSLLFYVYGFTFLAHILAAFKAKKYIVNASVRPN